MKTITLTEEEIKILKDVLESMDYDRWEYTQDEIEDLENIYNKLE